MTDAEKCIHCGAVATGYRYYCEATGRYECADCVVAQRDKAEAQMEAVRGPASRIIEGWTRRKDEMARVMVPIVWIDQLSRALPAKDDDND